MKRFFSSWFHFSFVPGTAAAAAVTAVIVADFSYTESAIVVSSAILLSNFSFLFCPSFRSPHSCFTIYYLFPLVWIGFCFKTQDKISFFRDWILSFLFCCFDTRIWEIKYQMKFVAHTTHICSYTRRLGQMV